MFRTQRLLPFTSYGSLPATDTQRNPMKNSPHADHAPRSSSDCPKAPQINAGIGMKKNHTTAESEERDVCEYGFG